MLIEIDWRKICGHISTRSKDFADDASKEPLLFGLLRPLAAPIDVRVAVRRGDVLEKPIRREHAALISIRSNPSTRSVQLTIVALDRHRQFDQIAIGVRQLNLIQEACKPWHDMLDIAGLIHDRQKQSAWALRPLLLGNDDRDRRQQMRDGDLNPIAGEPDRSRNGIELHIPAERRIGDALIGQRVGVVPNPAWAGIEIEADHPAQREPAGVDQIANTVRNDQHLDQHLLAGKRDGPAARALA